MTLNELRLYYTRTHADLWIFAYGSLIWNPDFTYSEKHVAALNGYKRKFSISCDMYRGTVDNPGLVFGLENGGTTHGVGFKVEDDARLEALDRVYNREMRHGHAYMPVLEDIRLQGGQTVEALTFVSNPASESHYGALSESEIAQRIYNASGLKGSNVEYAAKTHNALRAHDIYDPHVEDVHRRLARLENKTTQVDNSVDIINVAV